MCVNIMVKVKVKAESEKHKPEEVKNFYFCEYEMQFMLVCLIYAPQTYEKVLLTVILFQKYFLETLACYKYLMYWKELKPDLLDKP